jgi:hypothetical protein
MIFADPTTDIAFKKIFAVHPAQKNKTPTLNQNPIHNTLYKTGN